MSFKVLDSKLQPLFTSESVYLSPLPSIYKNRDAPKRFSRLLHPIMLQPLHTWVLGLVFSENITPQIPYTSGGAVNKNWPASAEEMGSIPGPGRFCVLQSYQAHAPQLLKACAPEPCSSTREVTAVRRPCSTAGE